MRTTELFEFITERHAVYKMRAAGFEKPWTKDKILQRYRFCNVYRELDKVTVWIRDNWRAPNANNPDLWFAMLVARKVNLPEAMADVGNPLPWDPKKFLKALDRRAK